MSLSDVAIRRPVLTTVFTIGVMVMGLLSYSNLGTDLFPDVNFPVVTITTVYPGASPAEVERQVSKPLEDAVAGISGLDTVRSFSRESMSTVIVIFKLATDIDEAATDVRERVAAARAKLPTEVRDPTVRRIDVSAAPIMVFVANGENMADSEVRRITEDQVKPALERVAGVAAVEVVGGKDREIRVDVHRQDIARLGIPLTAVVDKLRMENLNLPAGSYQEGPREISVRLRGDLRTAEEVADIAITQSESGTQILMKDIATVSDGFADMRTRIRANGRSAVAFEVQKASGMNTVEVAAAVQKRLKEIAPQLPTGYATREIMDTSVFILENAHEVEIAIFFGGAMAILVILIFMLDIRSTLISALALPTSVIATFILLDALDYTLNMMTLLGLSLSIGLLIDDAVVVRESIFRRLEKGEDPKTAASNGTKEIAFAVLATTLTVVAVFIPVAFMKGVVGQFFKQFGFTVAGAVMISLVVAFTLDPMLSAHFAAKVDHTKRRSWPVRMMEAMHQWVEDTYTTVLAFAVRHKLLTVVLGVAIFMGSMQLAGLMGTDFVAPEDRGQYMVSIELPAGTSLDETARRLLPAETKLLEDPNFVTVYSKLGPNMEVNKARWRVVTLPKTERDVGQLELQEQTRKVLEELVPEAKVSIEPPAFVEGLEEGAPLQVQVRGRDQDRLERNAVAVKRMLDGIAGLSDVRVQYSPGKPEQMLTIDRQRASELGVPMYAVARTLRAALDGEEAGNLRLEEGESKEVKIRVRLREQDRSSIERLGTLPIATAKGIVPLSDLLEVQPAAGPQVIERQDRTRQIVVSGVPNGRSLGEILEDLTPLLDAHDFGDDGYYRMEGQVKQMKETGEALGLALGLAVLFIYLILAAQFESFIHPATIMLSLPLAFVGAFVALFLTDSSMSMGSNIGIILLMGLVTKNAILLVDAALVNQRNGETALEAVMDAGRRRLRPILMTSAAMILGMVPTAISTGSGSEFRAPMAIAVIGGVITSTILTLVVVPAVFLWLDAIMGLAGRIRRKVFGGVKAAEIAGLVVVLTAGGMVGQARAQSVVTVEAAVTQALDASPDMEAARARIGEAEATRRKVMTAWQPDLKAVGSYTRNSEEAVFDLAPVVTGLAAAFPGLPPIDPAALPPPTVIQSKDQFAVVFAVDQTVFAMAPFLAADAADAGIEAQRTALAATRREIAFRVRELVHSVAGADQIIELAERGLDLAQARVKQAEARRAAGADVELTTLRAEAERTKAEQDLTRARIGREQILTVLGVLMHGPTPTGVVTPPPVDDPGADADSLIVRALTDRPDVLARKQALSATEAMIDEAELRWLPLVNVQGTARWTNSEGFTGEEWSWALTANLVLPLYDRGARYADADQRRAQLATQRAELRRAEQDVDAAVRGALLDVEAARQVLVTATAQVATARRTVEILDKAFAAGGITAFEVTEAATALRLAEQAESQQRTALQLSLLRLRHVAGM